MNKSHPDDWPLRPLVPEAYAEAYSWRGETQKPRADQTRHRISHLKFNPNVARSQITMSQNADRPSLNPTVEEEDEEIHTEPHTTETTAPRSRISWPEVREDLPA